MLEIVSILANFLPIPAGSLAWNIIPLLISMNIHCIHPSHPSIVFFNCNSPDMPSHKSKIPLINISKPQPNFLLITLALVLNNWARFLRVDLSIHKKDLQTLLISFKTLNMSLVHVSIHEDWVDKKYPSHVW